MTESKLDRSTGDARHLSAAELLKALHDKFSANFLAAAPRLHLADDAERRATALTKSSEVLKREAKAVHQQILATYFDEVFGDSVCALYLAGCGLTVPARMLLRRSLELGLVIIAYWDSAIEFWNWREHDGDIHFSELVGFLQRPAYLTFLCKESHGCAIDIAIILKDASGLYSALSNVVHPKPYNFSISGTSGYNFEEGDFRGTVDFCEKVHDVLIRLITARFSTPASSADGDN